MWNCHSWSGKQPQEVLMEKVNLIKKKLATFVMPSPSVCLSRRTLAPNPSFPVCPCCHSQLPARANSSPGIGQCMSRKYHRKISQLGEIRRVKNCLKFCTWRRTHWQDSEDFQPIALWQRILQIGCVFLAQQKAMCHPPSAGSCHASCFGMVSLACRMSGYNWFGIFEI